MVKILDKYLIKDLQNIIYSYTDNYRQNYENCLHEFKVIIKQYSYKPSMPILKKIKKYYIKPIKFKKIYTNWLLKDEIRDFFDAWKLEYNASWGNAQLYVLHRYMLLEIDY